MHTIINIFIFQTHQTWKSLANNFSTAAHNFRTTSYKILKAVTFFCYLFNKNSSNHNKLFSFPLEYYLNHPIQICILKFMKSDWEETRNTFQHVEEKKFIQKAKEQWICCGFGARAEKTEFLSTKKFDSNTFYCSQFFCTQENFPKALFIRFYDPNFKQLHASL